MEAIVEKVLGRTSVVVAQDKCQMAVMGCCMLRMAGR